MAPQANPSVTHSGPNINFKNYMATYDGKADINLYLVQFERSCLHAEIPKSKWSLHLQALLTTELVTVTAQLPDEEARDYDVVKSKLLERFQLTSDSARLKFRALDKGNEQTFPDFAFGLRTHFNSWLKLSGANNYEKLCDLILMEHFISKCPPVVKCWPQDKDKLEKIEPTALLAEEYVVRRKTNQQEAAKFKENKPAQVNPTNPKNSNSDSKGKGASAPKANNGNKPSSGNAKGKGNGNANHKLGNGKSNQKSGNGNGQSSSTNPPQAQNSDPNFDRRRNDQIVCFGCGEIGCYEPLLKLLSPGLIVET